MEGELQIFKKLFYIHIQVLHIYVNGEYYPFVSLSAL